jgi:predicted Zn-dependent peptidase
VTSAEKQEAELLAVAVAIKQILHHLPAAANSVGQAIDTLSEIVLSQPLTDAQIERTRTVIRAMLPPAPPRPAT